MILILGTFFMHWYHEKENMEPNTESGNFKSSSSCVISNEEPSRYISADDVDNLKLIGRDFKQELNATVEFADKKSKTSKGKEINLIDAGNICPKSTIEGRTDGIEEPMCQVKLDSLLELKTSTKKLICLLEEIQIKTQIRNSVIKLDTNLQNKKTKPIPAYNAPPLASEIFKDDTTKSEIEAQVKTFEDNLVKEEDECTVYKKITRRCQCFNQQDYNDFIIKFNDTKYFTSTMGEIIKNMRILKKFLYMEGDLTRHALMFLNEGLSDSTDEEKFDIAQGSAYADICNVFEDHSIVIHCISLLCKHKKAADITTQALAASFLYKLAHLENGINYLNFTSKITNDLKKLLRKKAAHLGTDTLESLNATLNILHPPLIQHTNAIYYCKTTESSKSEKICKKCDYKSPYRYRRPITTKTYAATLQNITIKRPKIIPTYTD